MTNDETNPNISMTKTGGASFRHLDFVIPSTFDIGHSSFNQPDRNRITIKLAFTRLNRSHDHKNEIEQMQDREQKKANKDETKNSGNQAVDQHRDLKIERLLAVRVDLGRIRSL